MPHLIYVLVFVFSLSIFEDIIVFEDIERDQIAAQLQFMNDKNPGLDNEIFVIGEITEENGAKILDHAVEVVLNLSLIQNLIISGYIIPECDEFGLFYRFKNNPKFGMAKYGIYSNLVDYCVTS